MLGPPLPRSQENQHGFPCYLSHFATVRVQERGFSLHELLMPSLIWFTHSYVFQILIITVFMLITSTALGARIHTHIHQLPSLKKKKKSHTQVTRALCSAGIGRAGAHTQAARCNPVPKLPQAPWGCPKSTSRSSLLSSALPQRWLPVPSGNTQGQPALATTQRPPHRCPHGSPEARHAGAGGAGLPGDAGP